MLLETDPSMPAVPVIPNPNTVVVDGNEAAAQIAYKMSEICAIYPITPSSTMGELCDEWASKEKKNIFGMVPKIIEMQSEAGAAGTIHGALQGGALASTFTSSQGLLLMIPNMYKIAGELTPTVFHIAARALATHALSIFGDHSDVMAARSTGFGMLFGCNAQEAMDLAMITHAATLKARIPFLNIFDGFRTSHELTKIEPLADEIIKKMIDDDYVSNHRDRSLNPTNPFVRGTAQNPDVFFQSREASNSFYQKAPSVIKEMMSRLYDLTGREYNPYEYHGAWDADRIIIIMGSGAGAVTETVDHLNSFGEKIGVVIVRMFRPFSVSDFLGVIPSTVRKVVVLDRCKEPGSIGEPLYQDAVTAFAEAWQGHMPGYLWRQIRTCIERVYSCNGEGYFRRTAERQTKESFHDRYR